MLDGEAFGQGVVKIVREFVARELKAADKKIVDDVMVVLADLEKQLNANASKVHGRLDAIERRLGMEAL